MIVQPLNYDVISLLDRFDLFEIQDAICEEVWPEFMLHDPVANTHWMQFINAFKDFQLMLMDDNEILAVVNAVPLHFDGYLQDLSDKGWDWGVAESVAGYNAGLAPNILMGVQIVINKKHQGKGLSAIAVREMSELAKRKGFNRLIIPVRPSDKHRFPLIPMEEYLKWTNSGGLPFDNWLRVHIRAGGEILKVCPEAMSIPGTHAQWSEWTGLEFPGSGSYIIPGALNPVSIDLGSNEGLYIEPNVWILHEVSNV
jgi:hypothetical protein